MAWYVRTKLAVIISRLGYCFLPSLLSTSTGIRSSLTSTLLVNFLQNNYKHQQLPTPKSKVEFHVMNVNDPSSMGTKDIRRELESLGVSMVGIIEKSELIDLLVKARKEERKEPSVSSCGRGHASASTHSTVSQGSVSRSAPIAIDAVP